MSTLLDRPLEVTIESLVVNSPQRGLIRDALEAESVSEVIPLVEVRHQRGLVFPAVEAHEHECPNHRDNRWTERAATVES